MGCDNRLLPGLGDPKQTSVLDDPRQRQILSILGDRSGPVDVQELVAEIAAMDSAAETRQVKVDLQHRCLPKLEAVGWIERERTQVTVAEPLPFGTGAVLPALDGPDDQFWDAVDALLGYPRRQELVGVIGEKQRPLGMAELADELTDQAAWDQYGGESTVRTLLHHVDLPKLADVGLIEYEPAAEEVTPTAFLMMLGNQIEPASADRRASCNDGS